MKSKSLSFALFVLGFATLTGLGGCITVKRDEVPAASTTTTAVSAPVGGTTVQRTTTTY